MLPKNISVVIPRQRDEWRTMNTDTYIPIDEGKDGTNMALKKLGMQIYT